jgi:thiamine biosynthesis lipoprotein
MLHGSLLNIMGTGLDALMIGKEEVVSSVWDAIVLEIKRLHHMLNRFDTSSEISYINNNACIYPVKVSDELWRILLDTGRYHQQTLGYFDITLSDYTRLYFDKENHSVFFDGYRISLDLGGYAKGYALKKIQEIFLDSDIRQALVNFGNSSVLAVGSHPHGKSWNIGVEHPFQPKVQLKIFELSGNSLSTSGNTSQHKNHIIDPHSGVFISEKKMVSVVSTNCIDAEVLTTALMVADSESVGKIQANFPGAASYTFNLQ